jgi:hypothetical protein
MTLFLPAEMSASYVECADIAASPILGSRESAGYICNAAGLVS